MVMVMDDGDTLPLSSLPGLTHTWWAAAIHTMTTQRYSLFFWSWNKEILFANDDDFKARPEQALCVQLWSGGQSCGGLNVQGGYHHSMQQLQHVQCTINNAQGGHHFIHHDRPTPIQIITPSSSFSIWKVGFPGLMSCVDFDMDQSSRYVGLCGIFFKKWHSASVVLVINPSTDWHHLWLGLQSRFGPKKIYPQNACSDYRGICDNAIFWSL